MNSNDDEDNNNKTLNEMMIKLEDNDRMYTVPINVNANAEEVAFAFCKEHNINYSHLPTLTKTIASFVNKRRDKTKRLFSIEEFIKRLKEKNEKKQQSKSRMMIMNTTMMMMTTNKSINTSASHCDKQVRTCTIIDNERHLDKFLSKRGGLVDALYNQLNVVLPKMNSNNRDSVIHNSELFLSFEQSARSKRQKIEPEIMRQKSITGAKGIKGSNGVIVGYAQKYLNTLGKDKVNNNKRVKTTS